MSEDLEKFRHHLRVMVQKLPKEDRPHFVRHFRGMLSALVDLVEEELLEPVS